MLQPHEQRVVTEHKELADKVEKLGSLIRGDVFYSLSSTEQGRLKRQYGYMQAYLGVLSERIDCFQNV